MRKILIDTNVLVYSYDRGEFDKQAQAIEVLQQLQPAGFGCLSVQCLAEFFVATTRQVAGKPPMLTLDQSALQVANLARAFQVLDLTPLIIQEATRGVLEHHLSYFDAQIWASARLNQIPVIFSEDFQSMQILDGVQFVDPIALDFDLGAWL